MSPKGKQVDLNPTLESLISSLERINSIVEKKAKELTICELETRAGMVDSIFGQLNLVQRDIEQNGVEPSLNKRQFYEEIYFDVKSRIVSAMAAHNRRQSTVFDSSHNMSSVAPNNSTAFARLASLPKIRIPIFSGKYTEWTNWFNTFVSFIDSDGELDKLSKFVHLRASLGPIPLRTIEALEITADNYSHALALLKERFENKSIIFQAHIKELFELPRLQRQNPSSLRELIDNVNSHLRALKSLGSMEDVANVTIYYLIRSKIDTDNLKKWEDDFKGDELPSWQSLSNFLAKRCVAMENRDLNLPSVSSTSSNEKTKKFSPVSLTVQREGQICPGCKSNHCFSSCPKFLKLSPMQRYFEAKKHALCILCLSDHHSTRDCNCAHCSECNGRHHKLLHRGNKKNSTGGTVPEGAAHVVQSNRITSNTSDANRSVDLSSSSVLYNSLLVSNPIKFLATAVLLIKDSSEKFVECRAILDSGSQLNFISEKMVKNIGLTLLPNNAVIKGIGNSTTESVGKVAAIIKSRVTNFSEALEFLVLPSITQYSPNISINIDQWHLPKNVKLADPKFNEARDIDMLIGVSTFFKLLSVGQIRLGENKPILQKSLLGWILAGEYRHQNNSANQIIANSAVENSDLSQLVEKFWDCESIEQHAVKLTPDEELCEKLFLSKFKHDSTGRIVVGLPFKNFPPNIGESYKIALKRFESLEKKFKYNSELKSEYVKFIEEYRSLGHLECVSSLLQSEVKYIMPHHAVLRPDSLSTKLRVVFDASCKSENGFSLNDQLFIGPRIQSDLFDILIRFRQFRYALTADISKMYRQVLIHPDDCNWQCILWRSDISQSIDILRLKTVTYGTSSAPYLAVRCLKYLANTYNEKYPIASQVLNNNFYMDDMLAGANTLPELMSLKQDMTDLLSLGKFELHKWRISSAAVDKIFTSTLEQEPLQILSDDCAKTLGVLWYSSQDVFRFSYSPKTSPKITKRVVLSELAQLFDPLGLINPIVVLGKVFMQEIWILRLDWDESLPLNLYEKWQKYRQELPLISEFSFPRYVSDLHSAEIVELHGFSDASNRAYGCAIYLRAIDTDGNITINLLTAKSRVAPLKSVSLPRLELQGAVMLAKLVNRIKLSSSLEFNFIYLWTDSTIVLNWLSAHPSRWLTFVANRVSLIHELSEVSSWRKIDSKSNPADIVSRGMWPAELRNSSLWFKGPLFLSSNTSPWPSQHSIMRAEDHAELDERRVKGFVLVSKIESREDVIANSTLANSFLKLNRVFGFIFRWVNNARRKLAGHSVLRGVSLTVNELRMGLNYILFNVQQSAFPSEIQALTANSICKSSKIQALSPFIDESGTVSLMRVGGRLVKSNLSFPTKHPVILPYDHPFTRALANYLHTINLHAGPLALLAFLRQRFWVLSGRKLARKVVRNCIACFKRRPTAVSQLMGALPHNRIESKTYPFQKTGMDFAGPIMIHFKLRGKRPVKAYLALFVCFVTKACHLEVVSDLSTPAFLCALKRFFARRGLSSDLYCDNATNFTGAARKIAEYSEMFNMDSKAKIQDECAARGVKFHFIPPHSPHMGGLWESAIKVAKSMLTHYINGASLTYEELSTVVTETEGIMNSRPLYPMSSDPNDLEALTPGHFLVGRPLNCMPEPFDEELQIPPVNRWKRIQHIKQLFWRRWTNEYLLSLQQRTKWKTKANNVQVGTLVLVAEDNSPPCKWLLGRIEALVYGQDGLVRVVTIRTSSGVIKRNIHRICPLPQEAKN